MNDTISNIKLLLCDVDGTLTDGGMYYSAEGDVMKRFYVRDGMGLRLLQQTGVKVGIVTSEMTPIVEQRARKLHLDYLVQGVGFEEKVAAVCKICRELGITMREVAYIGDDVNDIDLLKAVGFHACPADAIPEVLQIEKISIMQHNGGAGAVRELTDIIRANKNTI